MKEDANRVTLRQKTSTRRRYRWCKLLWAPKNFVELVNFVYGNTINKLLIDTGVKCVYVLRKQRTKVFGNFYLHYGRV